MISCFFERTRRVSSSSCASGVSLALILSVLTAARALLLRRIARDAYCRASSCSKVVLQEEFLVGVHFACGFYSDLT